MYARALVCGRAHLCRSGVRASLAERHDARVRLLRLLLDGAVLKDLDDSADKCHRDRHGDQDGHQVLGAVALLVVILDLLENRLGRKIRTRKDRKEECWTWSRCVDIRKTGGTSSSEEYSPAGYGCTGMSDSVSASVLPPDIAFPTVEMASPSRQKEEPVGLRADQPSKTINVVVRQRWERDLQRCFFPTTVFLFL